MEPSSNKHIPRTLIEPIKYRKTAPIDPQKITKYYPKNLKITSWSPRFNQDQSIRPIKNPSKVFETQKIASSTAYALNEKRTFQNAYFSSIIRNRSNSLSSFKLGAWQQINETRSKTILKSLTSLKNLRDFEIMASYCSFPATDDLHSLFNPLLFFKKLARFSFNASTCRGFQAKHMKALCASLTRLPWLQSLNLTFDGGDKFLEILIPALSKLLSLKKINFNFERNNSVQEETLIELFMTLSTLKNLTDITLPLVSEDSRLEPSAEGLQYLNPSSIRKLALDLSKNLHQKGFAEISQALKRFTSLQVLDLSLPEDLFNDRLSRLSLTLIDLKSLCSLGLTFQGFTENLAEAFKYLQHLAHLRLNFKNPNPFHEQIQLLSSSITARKSSLRSLEITFTWGSSLSDSLIESFAGALKKLTPLKYLLISLPYASETTSKGIQTLSLAIQGLSNLSSLSWSFENNKGIDEKIVEILFQALRGLPSLSSLSLDFSRNGQINIEEMDLRKFFYILCRMKNLSQLDLKLPLFKSRPWELMKLKQQLTTLRMDVVSNFLLIRT